METIDKPPYDNELRIIEYTNRKCETCVNNINGTCIIYDWTIDDTEHTCDYHTMASGPKVMKLTYDLNTDYHYDEASLAVDPSKSRLVLKSGEEIDMTKMEDTEWYSERRTFDMALSEYRIGVRDFYTHVKAIIENTNTITPEQLRAIYDNLRNRETEEMEGVKKDCRW